MGEAKRRKGSGIKTKKERFVELMKKISHYNDKAIRGFTNRRFK